MAIQILFNDTPASLDEQTLSITIQNNTLSNLSTRQVNYTNKFKLQKTPPNLQLLQNVGLLGSQSTIQNRNIPCQIRDGGVTILANGFANIVSIEGQYINVAIYDSSRTLKDLLEKRTLQQLNLSRHAHQLTLANIKATNDNPDLPYLYTDANLHESELQVEGLRIAYMLPFIKERYILNQIFSEAGLAYSGDIPNQSVVISPTRGYNIKVDTFAAQPEIGVTDFAYNIARVVNNIYYANPDAGRTLNTDDFGYTTFYQAGTYWNDIGGEPLSDTGKFLFKVNRNTIIDFTGTRPTDRGITIEQEAYLILTEGVSVKKVFPLRQGDNNITTDIEALPLSYRIYTGIRATYSGSSTVLPENINIIQRGQVSGEYEKLGDGQLIDLSELLPKMSQLEFVKEILWRYGLMIRQDKMRPNRYEFKYIEDILRGKEGTTDWSSKYVGNQSKAYGLPFGQINEFKYKDYEGYDQFADGNFTIESDISPPTKTAIQSKYEAHELDRLSQKHRLPIYGDTKDGILQYKSIAPRVYTIVNLEGRRVSIAGIPPIEADLYKITQNNLLYQQLVDIYYNALRQVASENEVVNVQFQLDGIDILRADLFKNYFVKQLGGVFYLNKINNYQANKPTSVELIRIPNRITTGVLPPEIDDNSGDIDNPILPPEFTPTIPETGLIVKITPSQLTIEEGSQATLLFTSTSSANRYAIFSVNFNGGAILDQSIDTQTGTGTITIQAAQIQDSLTRTIEATLELTIWDNDQRITTGIATVIIARPTTPVAPPETYIRIDPFTKISYRYTETINITGTYLNIADSVMSSFTYTAAVTAEQGAGVSSVQYAYDKDALTWKADIGIVADTRLVTASFQMTIRFNWGDTSLPESGNYVFTILVPPPPTDTTTPTDPTETPKPKPRTNDLTLQYLTTTRSPISQTWAFKSDIEGDDTHTLSILGLIVADNMIPPASVTVSNIPTRPKGDKYEPLFHLVATSRQTTYPSEIKQTIDAVSTAKAQVVLPNITRYNTAKNDWEQSLGIYAIENITDYTPASGHLLFTLSDNSPENFTKQIRVNYTLREATPAETTTRPTETVDCGGVDLGRTIELIKDGNKVAKQRVSDQYTSEFVIPYTLPAPDDTSEIEAGEVYTLRWTFNKATRPYNIRPSINHFIPIESGPDISAIPTIRTQTNVGIDVLEAIRSGLVNSQDTAKDIYEIVFRTISVDRSTISVAEQYIYHAISIVFRDSCSDVNSIRIRVRLFIRLNESAGRDCTHLIVPTRTIDLGGTHGYARRKTATIRSNTPIDEVEHITATSSPIVVGLDTNVNSLRRTLTAYRILRTPVSSQVSELVTDPDNITTLTHYISVKDRSEGTRGYICTKTIEVSADTILIGGVVIYLSNRTAYWALANNTYVDRVGGRNITRSVSLSVLWSEVFLKANYGVSVSETVVDTDAGQYLLNIANSFTDNFTDYFDLHFRILETPFTTTDGLSISSIDGEQSLTEVAVGSTAAGSKTILNPTGLFVSLPDNTTRNIARTVIEANLVEKLNNNYRYYDINIIFAQPPGDIKRLTITSIVGGGGGLFAAATGTIAQRTITITFEAIPIEQVRYTITGAAVERHSRVDNTEIVVIFTGNPSAINRTALLTYWSGSNPTQQTQTLTQLADTSVNPRYNLSVGNFGASLVRRGTRTAPPGGFGSARTSRVRVFVIGGAGAPVLNLQTSGAASTTTGRTTFVRDQGGYYIDIRFRVNTSTRSRSATFIIRDTTNRAPSVSFTLTQDGVTPTPSMSHSISGTVPVPASGGTLTITINQVGAGDIQLERGLTTFVTITELSKIANKAAYRVIFATNTKTTERVANFQYSGSTTGNTIFIRQAAGKVIVTGVSFGDDFSEHQYLAYAGPTGLTTNDPLGKVPDLSRVFHLNKDIGFNQGQTIKITASVTGAGASIVGSFNPNFASPTAAVIDPQQSQAMTKGIYFGVTYPANNYMTPVEFTLNWQVESRNPNVIFRGTKDYTLKGLFQQGEPFSNQIVVGPREVQIYIIDGSPGWMIVAIATRRAVELPLTASSVAISITNISGNATYQATQATGDFPSQVITGRAGGYSTFTLKGEGSIDRHENDDTSRPTYTTYYHSRLYKYTATQDTVARISVQWRTRLGETETIAAGTFNFPATT